MNTIEIITKKRDKKTLSQEEICHIHSTYHCDMKKMQLPLTAYRLL